MERSVIGEEGNILTGAFTTAQLGELSLQMDTTFIQTHGTLEGRFFYLMDASALEAILRALGMTE